MRDLPNPFDFESAAGAADRQVADAGRSSPSPASAITFSPLGVTETAPGMVRDWYSGDPDSTVSLLDKTRAAIVFGGVAAALARSVRDINSQIALRSLASYSTDIPTT